MISRIAFALLFLFSGLSFAADKDFNGRWDITVNEQAKKRAWWLEIAGAGSPSPSGSFVGAPGGQLDKIPEVKIDNGELRFSFKGNYDPKPAPPANRDLYGANRRRKASRDVRARGQQQSGQMGWSSGP
jgi:hypothetical protein